MEEKRQERGKLKIFCSYAEGTGKTRAMLEAALSAGRRGTDVVAGIVDPCGSEDNEALLARLEQIPPRRMQRENRMADEFDLDRALKRAPGLILVDELSHINAPGCRHQKRYQDVRELLKSGVDVYTTLNVAHIESLVDVVAEITGTTTEEHIPDSIFDTADQVELIDLEPGDLLQRQTGPNPEPWYTEENLAALREITLRRCADRANRVMESSGAEYRTDEHILVCLSSSPSNPKIIRTAARMASAFHCALTALFVKTRDYPAMSEEDRERLRANIHLAQQLDARIETISGDDIPFQIAEFARLSGISKIVIGRSSATKKGLFSKPTLTDKLIADAPNLDIHIIPDASSASDAYRPGKAGVEWRKSGIDIIKSLLILTLASLIGVLFDRLHFDEANIITVYVLGVLITSVITSNRIYSLVSSVVSVLVFNFLFTDPKLTLHAYGHGYPVTFVVMFLAAFITGTLANKLKSSAKASAQAAFRTKILFDANQMLQQADNRDEILAATANQLIKLLKKDIVIYPVEEGELAEPRLYSAREDPEADSSWLGEERDVAEWVLRNNKHAGATTQTFSQARCFYLALRVSDKVYGVVGIVMGRTPVEAYESSILLSILGECALALENDQNAREKEEAAILAKNEQLRSNLLRAISHDLRTPLTSISGNASNLLSNGEAFDAETKKQLYSDIYADSMWLINLVENLLSVTRLEEGRLDLHVSEELVEDVVSEALRHVRCQETGHTIRTVNEDDFLLARMDAKLMVQVVINLVDNAVKYTPAGSEIVVSTRREEDMAVISVADNGPGVPDEAKAHVFDMFYCGANQIADSRRSIGLGLSLCKSIINALGGTISVTDNVPHGANFTFTLPVGEVTLHE